MWLFWRKFSIFWDMFCPYIPQSCDLSSFLLFSTNQQHPVTDYLPICYTADTYYIYSMTLYKNYYRRLNLINRSIKLTLSPAACFSACAARLDPRAAGWGTRSRLWWETPSRRCNRNPGPGGPLHLEGGREGGAKRRYRSVLIWYRQTISAHVNIWLGHEYLANFSHLTIAEILRSCTLTYL